MQHPLDDDRSAARPEELSGSGRNRIDIGRLVLWLRAAIHSFLIFQFCLQNEAAVFVACVNAGSTAPFRLFTIHVGQCHVDLGVWQ